MQTRTGTYNGTAKTDVREVTELRERVSPTAAPPTRKFAVQSSLASQQPRANRFSRTAVRVMGRPSITRASMGRGGETTLAQHSGMEDQRG